MKRIVETKENEMEELLGEKVLLMCAGYFYYGTLSGVNDTRVELTNASIIYETGDWASNSWKERQKLPSEKTYVRLALVEAYFKTDKG